MNGGAILQRQESGYWGSQECPLVWEAGLKREGRRSAFPLKATWQLGLNLLVAGVSWTLPHGAKVRYQVRIAL